MPIALCCIKPRYSVSAKVNFSSFLTSTFGFMKILIIFLSFNHFFFPNPITAPSQKMYQDGSDQTARWPT